MMLEPYTAWWLSLETEERRIITRHAGIDDRIATWQWSNISKDLKKQLIEAFKELKKEAA